jgi:hypothetical protein
VEPVLQIGPTLPGIEKAFPGRGSLPDRGSPEGYKEMSSILADQLRPSFMSPNAGGGCGVSANENSCAHHVTWSQINFGDLTPYLTYGTALPASLDGASAPPVRYRQAFQDEPIGTFQ